MRSNTMSDPTRGQSTLCVASKNVRRCRPPELTHLYRRAGPVGTVGAVSDDEEEGVLEAELTDIPARSGAEIGVGIASAALQIVPLVGGPAAELIELVIGPSLGRRREEWFRKLAEVVDELRARLDGFDPRDLDGNEQFVSSVLAASTIAMRAHREEKLEMLRNTLINGVLPGAPNEHEQMVFLRLVDELTPLHVP